MTTDIEELQPSAPKTIDRNDLLPSDLVPLKLIPHLRTFIYELFEELYQQDNLLEWSHQQFRRACDKAVISFQRTHHCSISHNQVSYVYRQLKATDPELHQQAPSLQTQQFLVFQFEDWCLKKRSRCSSGVTVFSLMTSPHPRYQDKHGVWKTQRYSCKHNCYYCPNEPAHEGNNFQPQARSYLFKEPTVHRANRQKFSPSQQIWERGQVYLMNSHPVDKMEIIILGGTWSEYPRDYQEWFLGQVYWAANHLIEWCRLKSLGLDIINEPTDTETTSEATSTTAKRRSSTHKKNNKKIQYQEPNDPRRVNLPEYRGLVAEQEANKTAVCRVVGLTIETRPDAISVQTLYDARRWGVTRIQIGVQHTNQAILDLLNRGCTLEDATEATSMMMDFGFKVVYHWMPDLPGSSPEIDEAMFRRILLPTHDSNQQPTWDLLGDEWKIYPFSVLPWSVCETWEKEGKYQSYGTDRLIDVLIYAKRLMKKVDASSIRIVRLIRDIPVPYIIGGNKVAHLRQVIEKKLQQHGEYCPCIRCREIKNERPCFKYAHWKMIVKKVKTGGSRGWETPQAPPLSEVSPNNSLTPSYHQVLHSRHRLTKSCGIPLYHHQIPTLQNINQAFWIICNLILSWLWHLVDAMFWIIHPHCLGYWWWGGLQENAYNQHLTNLPVQWDRIPENLKSLKKSGNGYECFLSLEGGKFHLDKPIYGFIRFRATPFAGRNTFSALEDCLLVRELHVYGKSTGVVQWEKNYTMNTPKPSNTSTNSSTSIHPTTDYSPESQHRGIGSILLSMAEYHARAQGFRGIAIISGIGVQEYYKKRGYMEIQHYMIKYF